jgi:hypothetical protein
VPLCNSALLLPEIYQGLRGSTVSAWGVTPDNVLADVPKRIEIIYLLSIKCPSKKHSSVFRV